MKKLLLALLFCFACSGMSFSQETAHAAAPDKEPAKPKTVEDYGLLSAKHMQNGISYKLKTAKRNAMHDEMEGYIYHKGDRIRIDIDPARVYIQNKEMYFYNPSDNSAFKMPGAFSSVLNLARLQLPELKHGGMGTDLIILGTATVNGYKCVNVVSPKTSKEYFEACLTEDYGFPTYLKSKDSVSHLTQFNITRPDGDFSLPKTAKTTSFGFSSVIGNLFGGGGSSAGNPFDESIFGEEPVMPEEEAEEETIPLEPVILEPVQNESSSESVNGQGHKMRTITAKPVGPSGGPVAETVPADADPGENRELIDIALQNYEKAVNTKQTASDAKEQQQKQ